MRDGRGELSAERGTQAMRGHLSCAAALGDAVTDGDRWQQTS